MIFSRLVLSVMESFSESGVLSEFIDVSTDSKKQSAQQPAAEQRLTWFVRAGVLVSELAHTIRAEDRFQIRHVLRPLETLVHRHPQLVCISLCSTLALQIPLFPTLAVSDVQARARFLCALLESGVCIPAKRIHDAKKVVTRLSDETGERDEGLQRKLEQAFRRVLDDVSKS